MWCFSGKVKKAPNSEAKDKSNQSKCWFSRKKRTDPTSITPEPEPELRTGSPSPPPPPPPPRRIRASTTTLPAQPPKPESQPPPLAVPVGPESAKLSQADNKQQTEHGNDLVAATARAAEAAAAAAQAAAEIVRLTNASRPGKSKQEVAAIKIQTAFRGFLARRALRVLRGLKRLQRMMQGQAIKQQTTNTVKTMQTLARMQTEIRDRRVRMAEENLAHQKLIQQKHAKEQAKLEQGKQQKNTDDWDSSRITKEQIEEKLQSRYEAAIRRERTLAYSYTHQQTWKAAARSANTLFMDQNNPHWGWSWMERWLATRPWETVSIPEKDSTNNNSPQIKVSKFTLPKKEMTKPYAHNHNSEKPPPTSIPKQTRSSIGRLSTSSAPSKSVSSPVATRKLRSQTPRASPKASMWGPDEDARSTVSKHAGHSRRNSCSSAKDDNESIGTSQVVPSYMAPTESARARSRSVTPDRSSVTSIKRGSCSYTPSPTRSRRSTSSTVDINSISEHT